ncbi:MAG: alpha-L-fucosidase [Planctomycetaceae bacterium]|nr:alpha-L-fucosidase [Planctomycetaceae bacterium]
MRSFLLHASILLMLSPAGALVAQETRPSHEELVKMGLRASPEAFEWWQDSKFGIFIHWGVGIEVRHVEWGNYTDQRYWDHLYANLKHVTKFDATEWIDIVKAGGAKYVVFMTGINGAMQRRPGGNLVLWDTKMHENKLTRAGSPFPRDVCKEIADASHKAGIELEWYTGGEAGEKITELLTKYGPVRGIWFDGGFAPKGKTPEDVYANMRKLQPGILHNGALAGSKYGGDYGTPQHWYPAGGWAYNPVEVAAILRNGYWYWDTDAKGHSRSVKTLKQVIDLLIGCVGRGHNLVLNLAPKPDGSMEANEVERIKEVGAWLNQYGRSVYATRPGPYLPEAWGVSSHGKSDNFVYLHMLTDLDGGTLKLYGLDKKIVSVTLLNDPKVKVEVKQTPEGITLTVPKAAVDAVDTVFAVELDGPAKDAKVLYPKASLAQGKKATATQTFTWDGVGATMDRNGPHSAVDGDFASGWASRDKAPRSLTVDLGDEQTVSRVLVAHTETIAGGKKGFGGFRVECDKGGTWTTVFDSKSLKGPDRQRWTHEIAIAPTAARHWRITVSGDGAFIREFQLYAK